MSFIITIAESSFTSLGGGRVNPARLRQEILSSSSITDAIEDIKVGAFGSGQAVESTTTTGRSWALQFAGSGPSLAGSGATALNAIVAAHTGVMPDGGSRSNVRGFIRGLTLYGQTTSEVVVQAGECLDENGEDLIVCNADITLSITGTSFDGGSAFTGWGHVWAFSRRGHKTDCVARISQSSSSPTNPSGYVLRRRIGSVYMTSGSAILPFAQVGIGVNRRYYWMVNTTGSPCRLVSSGGATSWSSVTSLAPKTANMLYVYASNTGVGTARLRHSNHTGAPQGTAQITGLIGGMLDVPLEAQWLTGGSSIQHSVTVAGILTADQIGYGEDI